MADLEDEGHIRREKVGRRNRHTLDPGRPMRHPLESHHEVGELLSAMGHTSSDEA